MTDDLVTYLQLIDKSATIRYNYSSLMRLRHGYQSVLSVGHHSRQQSEWDFSHEVFTRVFIIREESKKKKKKNMQEGEMKAFPSHLDIFYYGCAFL